jgi:hypothetical protein
MHVVRWCDARTYEGMFDALFLLRKYGRGLAYCTSLDSPTFQKLRPHPPSHECSYPFISLCVLKKPYDRQRDGTLRCVLHVLQLAAERQLINCSSVQLVSDKPLKAEMSLLGLSYLSHSKIS